MAFISQTEPKDIHEALKHESWINAMQEELEQIEKNQVWTLISRPVDKNVVGTRWVFKNKLNIDEKIVRNKARLVAKGYIQEFSIDFEESYTLVARLEVVCLLLAYATSRKMKLYQMDVKSAFLNGYVNEELYMDQLSDFENTSYPNHVFKLKKALYALKQAPRAWYDRLSSFLLNKRYLRGKVDQTFFIKKQGKHILVVQIYVDDIIFGSTNKILCTKFSDIMKNEFEMSLMGELQFFLRL